MSDTVRLPGVTVEASRWLAQQDEGGLPTLLIDEAMLKRLAPQAVSQALPLVPGAFVQDYGGVGGLKSFSMRGGSASQSLVLIDGARLSTAQNGTVDLSLIPARFVREMHVVRGGASALYGANAITGVMNLRTQVADSTSIVGVATVGSFEEHRLGGGATVATNDVRVGLHAEHLTTSGAFPMDVDEFGQTYEINRANGDVRSTSALATIDVGDVLKVTGLLRSSERGVPGAVVQGGVAQAHARLDENDVLAFASGSLGRTDMGSVHVVGSLRSLRQQYTDPDATIAGPSGIDASYLQHDVNVGITLSGAFSGGYHSQRVDASYADLEGASIVTKDGELVVRRGIGASTDWNVINVLNTETNVRTALRVDVLSDMGVAVSPLLALQKSVTDDVLVRSSVSYNFRPPTFNELYFLNYGTQSLQPERSLMVEVGVSSAPLSWLMIDLDAYYGSVRNLILAVPISPVVTSAQNIGQATRTGLEAVVRGQWLDGNLRAQWTYAYQQVIDKTGRPGLDGTLVPYTAPELISAVVSWDNTVFTATAQWMYTSFRYAQAGNEYVSVLSPFSTINAQIGVYVRGQKTSADIRLQCDNVFDVRYAVVRGYPMPGRIVRAVVTMELNP